MTNTNNNQVTNEMLEAIDYKNEFPHMDDKFTKVEIDMVNGKFYYCAKSDWCGHIEIKVDFTPYDLKDLWFKVWVEKYNYQKRIDDDKLLNEMLNDYKNDNLETIKFFAPFNVDTTTYEKFAESVDEALWNDLYSYIDVCNTIEKLIDKLDVELVDNPILYSISFEENIKSNFEFTISEMEEMIKATKEKCEAEEKQEEEAKKIRHFAVTVEPNAIDCTNDRFDDLYVSPEDYEENYRINEEKIIEEECEKMIENYKGRTIETVWPHLPNININDVEFYYEDTDLYNRKFYPYLTFYCDMYIDDDNANKAGDDAITLEQILQEIDVMLYQEKPFLALWVENKKYDKEWYRCSVTWGENDSTYNDKDELIKVCDWGR